MAVMAAMPGLVTTMPGLVTTFQTVRYYVNYDYDYDYVNEFIYSHTRNMKHEAACRMSKTVSAETVMAHFACPPSIRLVAASVDLQFSEGCHTLFLENLRHPA